MNTQEKQIQDAIYGYVVCAEWLATNEDGHPLDDATITSECFAKVELDVRAFIEQNYDDFYAWDVQSSEGETSAENFGHNLYLSRNDYGAGFQDRGCELGKRLHEAARKLGWDYAEFET